MKPTIILVGADKGGVGKTTLCRILLDYFVRKNILTRAFDTEYPKGTLSRFYPDMTEIIDFSTVSDQMKVFDTLGEAKDRVTLLDLKAGNLSIALRVMDEIGALDAARGGEFNMGVFHVVGPAISSLEEISEVSPFLKGVDYIIARNFVNETKFFEWDQKTYRKYFSKTGSAQEISIPKLNEMAYEQVDLANATLKDFIDNRVENRNGNSSSFVLRGYVRKWSKDLDNELAKLNIVQELSNISGETASSQN
jgi:hypothetical protein